MKKTLLALSLLVVSSSALAGYGTVGVGTDKTLQVELGSNTEGFGGFIGMGVQLETSAAVGNSGNTTFKDFTSNMFVDQRTENTLNYYAGVNYTFEHSAAFKSTVGVGMEFNKFETFNNYHDISDHGARKEFGANGYFHTKVGSAYNTGHMINYVVEYNEVAYGLSYHSFNDEVVASIGFTF